MKRNIIILLLLSITCFVSFVFAAAYDDGTIRMKYLGLFFSNVFKLFKFPFFMERLFLFSLAVNVIFYCIVINLLIKLINKLGAYFER